MIPLLLWLIASAAGALSTVDLAAKDITGRHLIQHWYLWFTAPALFILMSGFVLLEDYTAWPGFVADMYNELMKKAE